MAKKIQDTVYTDATFQSGEAQAVPVMGPVGH